MRVTPTGYRHIWPGSPSGHLWPATRPNPPSTQHRGRLPATAGRQHAPTRAPPSTRGEVSPGRAQAVLSSTCQAGAMRILVVEDDRSVRDALDRALRAQDLEVVTAGDGLQALRAVTEQDPDLVVLDLGLPGMDGLAVCRRLRADGDDRPVLILTARDGVDDRVTGL